MADPFFSELKYLGGPPQDFIEIQVDGGYDVTDLVVTIYNANGTIRSTTSLNGLTPTTVAGKDIYVIDNSVGTFTGLGKTNAVSLSENGTVYSFVSFDDNAATVTATQGPASGLTSTDIGQAGAGSSLVSTTGDVNSYTVNTSPTPGSIPCLTGGTLVRTADGARLVEDLLPGTLVETFGGSHRPIAHVLHRHITKTDLQENARLYPVRICKGALGQGLPIRDLLVSRQHRMLVTSPIVKRMFGVSEVLIAAIKLTDLPGIYVDMSVTSVTYYHIVMEEHLVLFAEGAPTESLLLGPEALKSLPPASLQELREIFPDELEIHNPQSACHIPVNRRQVKLVARHAQNNRSVLASYKTQR
ncbi:Hint domain-containing protein [Aliiroseovarius sp. F20344]|uniref:Hint domain-containing protein n=1 Tax=Aliiroseovarius sp. F20344 TaxID=2926414 RepID=UPI001FF6E7BE|nr:Hint domain-containing protein [Aliiroseovarius sp. F20344]MCK0142504.1 Hint domain-containing protein [Aliiroseovarius sp. F20344]